MAEQLAELFESGAADGFLITPTHFPGSFDEFGRAVVPHLQRLGVFRTEYAGTTLRENLGSDDRDRGRPGDGVVADARRRSSWR